MNSIFKKVSLGTALVVTAASALIATPAAAQGWRGGDYRHGGDGAGVAIAAGIVGLAVGAALADQGSDYGSPEPVGYAPYGGPADCYQAYPGYDNTCYPVENYYRMGWSWRDGSWWSRDGQRYARPFMGRGGPGGGYGGGHGGDQRGGYRGGNYAGGGMQGDYGGGRGPGNGGGYAGGHAQDGGHGGYGGEGGGRGDGRGRSPGGGGEHR